jgi:selenocysteine lyase/cysteine desulfurase
MTTRRDFLKTLTMASFALPANMQWDFAESKVDGMVFPADDDPASWKRIRKMFPMPEDQAFFNTGTLGAQPTVVLESTIAHMRKVATDIAEWDYKGDDWISGYQPYTDLRAKVGRLINAKSEEIALTENATMAMNTIAHGLELDPGSEVLMTDMEHSGGRSGWLVREKRFGIKVISVPLPDPCRDPEQIIDLFLKAITPRTRVIAISHMISGTGSILPVKQICSDARRRGIFTVLDGAQCVGQIPVDVKDIGCDAYFSSLHKWMLAPPGTGFLYIRKERIPEIWTTFAGGQWDNHEDEGYRLSQRGTGNLSLLVGLDAALDFHFRIGPEKVYRRIKFLGDYLRDRLRKIPKIEIHTSPHPDMCAGITVYNIKGMEPGKIMDELWQQKKIRIRGVRQSTHIYNNPDEIDATLEVVHDMATSSENHTISTFHWPEYLSGR